MKEYKLNSCILGSLSLLLLSLFIGTAQADKRPSMACVYMDENYKKFVSDPLIVFGPTKYTVIKDTFDGFDLNSIITYNDRYKRLNKMVFIELPKVYPDGRISVKVRGDVIRPHSKRPTEVNELSPPQSSGVSSLTQTVLTDNQHAIWCKVL